MSPDSKNLENLSFYHPKMKNFYHIWNKLLLKMEYLNLKKTLLNNKS